MEQPHSCQSKMEQLYYLPFQYGDRSNGCLGLHFHVCVGTGVCWGRGHTLDNINTHWMCVLEIILGDLLRALGDSACIGVHVDFCYPMCAHFTNACTLGHMTHIT